MSEPFNTQRAPRSIVFTFKLLCSLSQILTQTLPTVLGSCIGNTFFFFIIAFHKFSQEEGFHTGWALSHVDFRQPAKWGLPESHQAGERIRLYSGTQALKSFQFYSLPSDAYQAVLIMWAVIFQGFCRAALEEMELVPVKTPYIFLFFPRFRSFSLMHAHRVVVSQWFGEVDSDHFFFFCHFFPLLLGRERSSLCHFGWYHFRTLNLNSTVEASCPSVWG